MGLCIGFGGFPILADKACQEAYRQQRNEHKQIEEDSDVAKNASNNDRKKNNTDSRNEQQALSGYFRNFGSGEGDAATIAGSYFGALGSIGAAAAPIVGAGLTGGTSLLPGVLGGGLDSLSSLFGGGSAAGAAPVPLTSNPLFWLGLAAVGAVIVMESK